jgi:hypothetical protein
MFRTYVNAPGTVLGRVPGGFVVRLDNDEVYSVDVGRASGETRQVCDEIQRSRRDMRVHVELTVVKMNESRATYRHDAEVITVKKIAHTLMPLEAPRAAAWASEEEQGLLAFEEVSEE